MPPKPPMPHPRPAPSLAAAYGATTYRVLLPQGALDLRVGALAPGGLGPFPWMVITACNPGSLKLSEEENHVRQEALVARLRALGLPFVAAENLADAGDWPVERGFWVSSPRLGRPLALALGREFGQVAVLWGQTGDVAQLLWSEGEPQV